MYINIISNHTLRLNGTKNCLFELIFIVGGNDIYDASVGDTTPVGYKTFIELVKLVKKLEKNSGGSTGGGSESI